MLNCFHHTGPSVTIPETTAIGTSVYKLTASDPDGNDLLVSFFSLIYET